MNKSISDSTKLKKIRQEIEQFSQLLKLMKLTPAWKGFREKFKSQIEEFARLEKEIEIFDLPDAFNSHFSDLGWISYESLNADTMRRAIEIKTTLGIQDAELFLTDTYNEEYVHFGILRLHGCLHFRERLPLVEKARRLFIDENYESCILLLLSIIDGGTQGISNHVGFFADTSDIEMPDSISGHSTGIPKIQKLFSRSRLGTNLDEITIPYRNGIIHGRDLNYGNKIVAAKCWATLFALADLDRERRNPAKVEPEKSWSEIFEQLAETQELKNLISEWKPRNSEKTLAAHNCFESISLDENSPEKAVAEFCELWKAKNYGKMADYLGFLVGTKGKIAGGARNDFGSREPQSFQITGFEDEASAISNVSITIMSNDRPYNLILRCTYLDEIGNPTTRNAKGEWKIIQAGFAPIIYES